MKHTQISKFETTLVEVNTMTTTSITSPEFGKAYYQINWDLDGNEFDYESATEFYHDQIVNHFDSICKKFGSSGSLYLYSSEVYVDIEDDTGIDFWDAIEEAATKAYDDLCKAAEKGQFDYCQLQ